VHGFGVSARRNNEFQQVHHAGSTGPAGDPDRTLRRVTGELQVQALYARLQGIDGHRVRGDLDGWPLRKLPQGRFQALRTLDKGLERRLPGHAARGEGRGNPQLRERGGSASTSARMLPVAASCVQRRGGVRADTAPSRASMTAHSSGGA